jgi:hypothetical protein
MKSTSDRIYCYPRQAHNCIRNAGVTGKNHPRILYSPMNTVKTLDMDDTPRCNSAIVIKDACRTSGNPDPFKEEKINSNNLAEDLLEKIKTDVGRAELHRLLQISSAGNIIDPGIIFEYDIEKTMRDTIERGFSVDYYSVSAEKLEKAETVPCLGDNCGEIVFDAPVAGFLHESCKRIYYVVKSGPALNDALCYDAFFAGIDKFTTIAGTGSGFPGVNRDDSSAEFADMPERADLIISKGQANFESLDGDERIHGRIFFILKIRCERAAEKISGSSVGDSVLYDPDFGGF